MRSGVRGDNTTTPQKHTISDNQFQYLFCQDACVLRHDIPDMAYPQYVEFSNNTYQDIYGIKGALIHSVTEPQVSDASTYSIYNFTTELLQNVQNGAIHVEGYQNDAIVLMNEVTILDCWGTNDTAVVDLS